MLKRRILGISAYLLCVTCVIAGISGYWRRTLDRWWDVSDRWPGQEKRRLEQALIERQRVLLERYPVENLASRLEYESVTLADPKSTFVATASKGRTLSPTLLARLDSSNHVKDNWRRSEALKELHQRNATEFFKRPKNGISRMPTLAQIVDWDYASDKQTLTLSTGDSGSFVIIDGKTMRSKPLTSIESDLQLAVPTRGALLQFHDSESGRFADSNLSGWVVKRQQAVGFVSHRFLSQIAPIKTPEADLVWSIVRLELVSLLKHQEARVYISKELPQLERLKDVPTRPLNDFEEQALAKLWHDEDVVIAEEQRNIRMLGSLRAQKECIQCHSVKHGQLLGAFSYELGPRRTQQLTEQDVLLE